MELTADRHERNDALRTAWEFVENTGHSIFLTGKAGTGKTTFLHTVVERSRKRSIVVAPTGVAAINAGGVTIHSFFQLPLSPYIPGVRSQQRFNFSNEKRRLIASLDLVIIDEISMVRADLLDAIDNVLRRYRDSRLPFGGVQLLMIGDLQQLTPVVTPDEEALLSSYYDTPYFFSSKALKDIDYVTIQLEKVYRQQDDTFITLLNHIRTGQCTANDLALLNSRYQPAFRPSAQEDYIRLTTHNRKADLYNESNLRSLPTPSFRYQAEIENTFPEYAYPTSVELELKVGAQVMFVRNDPTGNQLYYNGRIGRVSYADKDKIRVRCTGDTSDIEVEPVTWENMRYTLNDETHELESAVEGTFCQYPLRLAWAITIHKSQGLTFDHAIIEADQSFAPGQVYVALSRCRTLEGMVLASPIPPTAILQDNRVDSYIAQEAAHTAQSIQRLPALKEAYYRQLVLELFDFVPLMTLERRMIRLFSDYFSNSHPSLLQLHKQTADQMETAVMDVSRKWKSQITHMTTEELHADVFLDRLAKSTAYFSGKLKELFEKPTQLSGTVITNNKEARTRLKNLLELLKQTWMTRHALLSAISQEGFSITNYLKIKQRTSSLSTLEKKPSQGMRGRQSEPGQKPRRERKPKAPKAAEEEKEKTWEVSYRLFLEGRTPEQIAEARLLSPATIYNHLTRYVEKGVIPLERFIASERQQLIREAILKTGQRNDTSAIKKACPPDVTYWEIWMMLNTTKED